MIFVPFSDGRPSGLLVDVLTGFVSVDDEALGRPVGVAAGALLVAVMSATACGELDPRLAATEH